MSNEKVCQSRHFFNFFIVKLVFLVRYLTGVGRTNSLVVVFLIVFLCLLYLFCSFVISFL